MNSSFLTLRRFCSSCLDSRKVFKMMRAMKGVRHLHTSTLKQAVSELSVPVPWGEIRGKIWGPDHGRPVLCVHGWSDNCGTFNTLIPLLPKDCRYVAIDLVGHGLSSHRPPGVLYNFPSYVMDVRRVVDALQWNKFSIIGHSMGGNIAGPFSALYPEMVDALVLLDCYGFLPTDKQQLVKRDSADVPLHGITQLEHDGPTLSGLKEIPKVIRRGMDEMIQFDKNPEKTTKVYTYEKAVERLLAANPSLSEQGVRILLERGLVQVEGGVAFSRDFRINLTNTVRITLEQSLLMQSRIQASILVILAEDGFDKLYVKQEHKKIMEALLQGYRDRHHTVVTVPGNHHVHLDKPEVIAPLVSEFLQNKVLSQSADKHTSKL